MPKTKINSRSRKNTASSRFACRLCNRAFASQQAIESHTTQSHRTEMDEELKASAPRLNSTLAHQLSLNTTPLPDSNPPLSEVFEIDVSMFDAAAPRSDPEQDRLFSPSRRPSVEDVEDDYCTEDYPAPVATVLRTDSTPFEEFRASHNWAAEGPSYSPFEDKGEWDFAKWILGNVGQKATDEYLKLDKVKSKMGLSFHNNRKFMQKVDSLPHSAPWTLKEVTVTGTVREVDGQPKTQSVELWMRNPVDCVRELWANPRFSNLLAYKPVRLQQKLRNRNLRCYGEMWTADWWWQTQAKLPVNATVAPVILASDSTKLSSFAGDQKAYPVYLTLGNIPKAVRRKVDMYATVLVAYLPVSKLDVFPKKDRGDANQRLFHYCMQEILRPLETAGKDGVELVGGDGRVRSVYPILAAYVADQPEQCLVACCRQNRCFTCKCPAQRRGEPGEWMLRTEVETLDLMQKGPSDPRFEADGLRNVYPPFWAYLPHSNIFSSFTPDMLHQLHKGLFGDHVLKWCRGIIGDEEIDRRFMAMPNHPSLRHFKNGVSLISQWNGKEYQNAEKVIAGVVASHSDHRLAQAVRALLDFIYCARLPMHSDDTLAFMQDAYDRFHKAKAVFRDHGQRSDFNLPKLHAISHYIRAIRLFGAADGYNTENPERFHIDYAKKGYRASNRREYVGQMTTWLSRRESVSLFDSYLAMYADVQHPAEDEDQVGDDWDASEETRHEHWESALVPVEGQLAYQLPKHPSFRARMVDDIIVLHKAPNFVNCLKIFIQDHIPTCRIRPGGHDRFEVYKRFAIISHKSSDMDPAAFVAVRDVIRATPAVPRRPGYKGIAERFDTCLLLDDGAADDSLKSHRAVRVRAIFTLPSSYRYPHPLAYIEYFKPFIARRRGDINLLQTSRMPVGFGTCNTIIRLDSIRRSCHLLPKFATPMDCNWNSENVLDLGDAFYLNEFLDDSIFGMA